MTGLDNIISEITEDAKKRADEIIENAKKQSDSIIAEAEKKAKAISLESEKETEEKCKFIAERNKSAYELDKSKRLLCEKQRIISEIIEKTLTKLVNLPDNEYFELILKLIKDHQTGETGEIAFNEKDKARLPKDFLDKVNATSNNKLKISDKTRKIDSGFVLIYNGVEENCSFKAMQISRDEELRDTVAQMLF